MCSIESKLEEMYDYLTDVKKVFNGFLYQPPNIPVDIKRQLLVVLTDVERLSIIIDDCSEEPEALGE